MGNLSDDANKILDQRHQEYFAGAAKQAADEREAESLTCEFVDECIAMDVALVPVWTYTTGKAINYEKYEIPDRYLGHGWRVDIDHSYDEYQSISRYVIMEDGMAVHSISKLKKDMNFLRDGWRHVLPESISDDICLVGAINIVPGSGYQLDVRTWRRGLVESLARFKIAKENPQ